MNNVIFVTRVVINLVSKLGYDFLLSIMESREKIYGGKKVG